MRFCMMLESIMRKENLNQELEDDDGEGIQ